MSKRSAKKSSTKKSAATPSEEVKEAVDAATLPPPATTATTTPPPPPPAATKAEVAPAEEDSDDDYELDLWKEIFLVGTEWEHYDGVYKPQYAWSFKNLMKELDHGCLRNEAVWLFGTTEPQMVPHTINGAVVQKVAYVPVVVAVVTALPPPAQLGIKSVQMAQEQIVKMDYLKMGWRPYIPKTVTRMEKYKPKIFYLHCYQRRAGLKRLKEERLLEYQYCMPYIMIPSRFTSDDNEDDAFVTCNLSLDVGGGEVKKLDEEFDPEGDAEEMDEFAQQLIEMHSLPATVADQIKEQASAAIKAYKQKRKEERLAKRRRLEDIPADVRAALDSMKLFKFYPSSKTVDLTDFKSKFINRYYGNATQVF